MLILPRDLCETGEDVFACLSRPPRLGRSHLDFLKARAFKSRRGRSRICAHEGSEDAVQEMLIVIREDSYIQPHRHVGKCESFHVVEGAADVAIFDEPGHLVDVITLGEARVSDVFFCRIPIGVFHALLVRTPLFAMHEVTRGPFVPGDAEMAMFAPAESDHAAARIYASELRKTTFSFRGVRESLPPGQK